MALDNLELRDIQLPDPVSWWPPAMGWWFVLVGIILFFIAAIFLFKKWQGKRRSAKVLARIELQKIEQEFSDKPDQKYLIKNLSTLLRRSSLSSFPREDCAGLTGEEWLSFLDQVMQGEHFTRGVGRSLITAPYEKEMNINAEQLLTLCKDWIEALP